MGGESSSDDSVSCSNKKAKNIVADKLKERIIKHIVEKSPNLAERLSKMQISFDIIDKNKKPTKDSIGGFESVGCGVKMIKFKLDTGDILSYETNALLTVRISQQNGLEAWLQNTGRWYDDVRNDLRDYYSGKGVMIEGKRKSGCNGIYQEKDKNGEITIEGACENGLKNGVWKYYDNGLLTQEDLYKDGLLNGTSKFYERMSGKMVLTADYVDGKLNGFVKSYDDNGNLEGFTPYKDDVVDGIVLNGNISKGKGIDYGKGKGELGRYKYMEVSNGKLILGRNSDYIIAGLPGSPGDASDERYGTLLSSAKNEKELLDWHLKNETTVIDEGIIIDNLTLITRRAAPRNVPSGMKFVFIKNDEEIGGGKLVVEVFRLGPYSGGRIESDVELNNGLILRRELTTYGLCQKQKGKCEEIFKELIDKSVYKDEIYAVLSGIEPDVTIRLYPILKEYMKTNDTHSTDNANETPNTQSADEAKASANEQSSVNEQIKPSFDCAKASTNAEKLVCSDNELANLDNELSKAYANARNLLDNAGKKELTSEQKAWLETYNQCADKECVKQNLQKRIEILKSTDMQIYLATKDEFVNLRKSPNGEIITPIYKKDFDKIILKRLGVEDKWLKVLYFPPNVSDEKEALTGYIHNSQIK